jgi:hypothetical protein
MAVVVVVVVVVVNRDGSLDASSVTRTSMAAEKKKHSQRTACPSFKPNDYS